MNRPLILVLVLACISCKSFSSYLTSAHHKNCYTQGLFFLNSTHMFESCGMYNISYFHVLHYQSANGKLSITQQYKSTFPYQPNVFLEGSTSFNNRIYMLTWVDRIVYVLNQSTFQLLHTKAWDRQGWGITHNDTVLFISDGSTTIYACNQNIEILDQKSIVDMKGKPVMNINELEYVNGYIWANVYMTNRIIKIDYQSGKVVQEHSGQILKKNQKGLKRDEVLNGIAYNHENGKFILTGKNWNNYYQIQL